MKKYILLLLLFIPFAFANTEEKTFSSSLTLRIDTGDNIVNILIEGTNSTYSIANSTNSYTIHFKRNVTCSNSTQQVANYYYGTAVDNVSVVLTEMSSKCQKIADAYGDASSYYKPLLECTTGKSQCEKDRDSYKQNSDKLVSLESNHNTCLNDKKNMESQFASCSTNLQALQSTSSENETKLKDASSTRTMYGWGLVIAAIAIAGYFYHTKKKERAHPLEGMPPQH